MGDRPKNGGGSIKNTISILKKKNWTELRIADVRRFRRINLVVSGRQRCTYRLGKLVEGPDLTQIHRDKSFHKHLSKLGNGTSDATMLARGV